MKRIFIDTNVFLRFLLDDDQGKARDVGKLLEAVAAGKIKAETHMIVIAELVWVLSSFYKVSRKEVSEYMNLLFAVKNLSIKDGAVVRDAIDLYRQESVDFIDAFCASLAIKMKIKLVCSYDKDFDKLKDIKRVEPTELF